MLLSRLSYYQIQLEIICGYHIKVAFVFKTKWTDFFCRERNQSQLLTHTDCIRFFPLNHFIIFLFSFLLKSVTSFWRSIQYNFDIS